MTEILNSVWLQLGGVGLFAMSGWVMWWFARQDAMVRMMERDRRLNKLFEMFTDVLAENSRTLAVIADRVKPGAGDGD